jgi:hypothetical protein
VDTKLLLTETYLNSIYLGGSGGWIGDRPHRSGGLWCFDAEATACVGPGFRLMRLFVDVVPQTSRSGSSICLTLDPCGIVRRVGLQSSTSSKASAGAAEASTGAEARP